MRRDVGAGKHDLPFARARLAADRHHQGRLAGPVGADQGDDLAFVDLEVDPAQRRDVAVIGLHAAHREQAGLSGGSLRAHCDPAIPAFCTTSAHLPISDLTNAASSALVAGPTGSMPSCTACVLISGSATTRPISALSTLTMSAGVPLGAIAICQEVISKPGTAASSGAVAGRASTRAFDVNPSAVSLPAAIMPRAGATSVNITCT